MFLENFRYEGHWKSGKRHGKGIDYYKNGAIMYEGDFANGKYEGYGKLYTEKGDFYIGQFKNGKFHGRVTSQIRYTFKKISR